MRVHEAARAAGVTPRALRFYEEKRLIGPAKNEENGYRIYTNEDLRQIRWVVSLRELGMPIADIQAVMQLIDRPERFLLKLDEARAALYEQWLGAGAALRALDGAMADWLDAEKDRLADLEAAALQMKRLRQLRSAWSDSWDYDAIARLHGYEAPIASLGSDISQHLYESALLRTAEWIDPAEGESGLDAGAGSGNLTALLAASGAKLVAVEQSAEMLGIVRRRLPQVDARLGNLLALPLGDASLDFAACSFALQHLNGAQQLLALQELDRVLKQGGRMIVTGLMTTETEERDIIDKVDQEVRQNIHNNRSRSANVKSPDNKVGAFFPSLLSELVEWLEQQGYTVITQPLGDSVHLIAAAK